MDSGDGDPNEDPEYVRLFTITSSDDESDSDDDSPVFPRILQPTHSSFDRAARVQQANRELFSKPFSKKKVKCKVQFDLVPQDISGDCGDDEGGGGGGELRESNTENHRSYFQRRDTGRLVLPRRFSSMEYNQLDVNKRQSGNQRPNHVHSQFQTRSVRAPAPHHTAEEPKPQPVADRSKELSVETSMQSSEQVVQQSRPPTPTPTRPSTDEGTSGSRPSRQSTSDLKPKPPKQNNPPNGDGKK